MKPQVLPRRSVLPVLYIGRDLPIDAYESLRAHRIGVVSTDSTARACRLLAHFRVAAVVLASPNLPGLRALGELRIPIIVLAAGDAPCDLEGVTILRRKADPQELAAVIHGVIRRDPGSDAARDAA